MALILTSPAGKVLMTPGVNMLSGSRGGVPNYLFGGHPVVILHYIAPF